MQKTAYEMRIRDWSSDVCSSDLEVAQGDNGELVRRLPLNGEFAAPAVVVVKAQGRLAPLPFAGDTVEQGSVDLLVAVAEDVGLHLQAAAHHRLGREASAVDLRRDRLDRHAKRRQRLQPCFGRSDARRVGKEGGRTLRSRWARYH